MSLIFIASVPSLRQMSESLRLIVRSHVLILVIISSYVGFLTLLYLQHKDLHFCNFMVMPLSPADEKHVSVILASGAVHAACCMNEHRHELMLKE